MAKIALIGYGKMGMTIEKIALEKGHEIILKISRENRSDLTPASLKNADVAIEFTAPDTAVENILFCLGQGVPVVCGTTGWLDDLQKVEERCRQMNGTFLYASNFSIGVNLFFRLNEYLAELMKPWPVYRVQVTETHHTQKKDAPSGTAISIAEQIIRKSDLLSTWKNEENVTENQLSIISKREDEVPGTHLISYSSPIDDIEIRHTAHNREGFAAGAVIAAEFLIGKMGIFSMQDVMDSITTTSQKRKRPL